MSNVPAATGGVAGPKAKAASIMLYVLGGISIVFGALVLMATNSALTVFAVILLVVGIAYIVLGRLVGRGSETAIWVAIVLVGLSLVSNLAQLTNAAVNKGSTIVGIAISAVLLFLLWQARTEVAGRV